MSVRIGVKVAGEGRREKERGQRRHGPYAKFQSRHERNRAAVHSCLVSTLHKAPREGSEAEMEPTLHSQNCVPGKGLRLPRRRTLSHIGMAQ